MRVLVTGASGFVGRALVHRLSGRSAFAVRAAVRQPSPLLPKAVPQVTAPDLDGAASQDWAEVTANTDVVVHLAARVHVMREHSTDPLADFRRINVDGTTALARGAAAAGVKRFVFLSTVKVSGEASRAGVPLRESDAPGPSDPYGVSKAEAEAALFELAAQSGMQVVVIRPTMVYGPSAKGNFRALARWIGRGFPVPLGGIRDNRRSLVGIDNLVDFIERCLVHPAAANQIFFVADGEDMSTADLVTRMARAAGTRARLIRVPAWVVATVATLVGRRDAWRRLAGTLQVDTSKARSLLDWTPPIPVDEGLRRALASHDASPRAAS